MYHSRVQNSCIIVICSQASTPTSSFVRTFLPRSFHHDGLVCRSNHLGPDHPVHPSSIDRTTTRERSLAHCSPSAHWNLLCSWKCDLDCQFSLFFFCADRRVEMLIFSPVHVLDPRIRHAPIRLPRRSLAPRPSFLPHASFPPPWNSSLRSRSYSFVFSLDNSY